MENLPALLFWGAAISMFGSLALGVGLAAVVGVL